MNALTDRMKALDEVEKLNDGELIDAVVDEVFSDLSLGSRQSVLLTTLIERFQKSIGLLETPAGITQDSRRSMAGCDW